jgi:diacylglycerol kinase family enzyme
MRYTSVDIIYNPNSTGPSDKLARELRKAIKRHYPQLSVKLRATQHAGHAEELAYQCALSSKRPLIISSSGDGGYNEVINGAIRAQTKGADPTCAVLPAGNANDHSRTLQKRPLLDIIISGNEETIDLLRATFTSQGQKRERYAHSYIGLGLTPIVAVELNKTSLNALKEMWIVLRTFLKFRPFKIKTGSKTIALDSILFTNIEQMAKVLTIAQGAKPNDGVFEITVFPHAHKLRLFHMLAKATTDGLQQNHRAKEYVFKVAKKVPAQFDGEVEFIDGHSKVGIYIEPKVLKTLL